MTQTLWLLLQKEGETCYYGECYPVKTIFLQDRYEKVIFMGPILFNYIYHKQSFSRHRVQTHVP